MTRFRLGGREVASRGKRLRRGSRGRGWRLVERERREEKVRFRFKSEKTARSGI